MNRFAVRLTIRLSSSVLLSVILAVILADGFRQAQAQTVPTALPAATSSLPTSTSAAAANNVLPIGTLILLQQNQPIALPPSLKPISLKPQQYGVQAAGTYKTGVQFVRASAAANSPINLTWIDNSSGQTKPIPQGAGLFAPAVAWKNDGSGFAFYDFPPPGKTPPNAGAILYYDVASNATQILVPPTPNQAATAVAWSPDGRYLVYLVGNPSAEAANGPDLKPFLYDATAHKSMPLPAEASGFTAWDRAGTGFFVLRGGDVSSTASQFVYYSLAALTTPKVLTPAKTADQLIDTSPDGKRIVVASSAVSQGASATNLVIMNFDGTNRTPITTFKASDQTITALFWGADGIYYSLSAKPDDTTWRIDLDGKNARQVAVGTLIGIVGG